MRWTAFSTDIFSAATISDGTFLDDMSIGEGSLGGRVVSYVRDSDDSSGYINAVSLECSIISVKVEVRISSRDYITYTDDFDTR